MVPNMTPYDRFEAIKNINKSSCAHVYDTLCIHVSLVFKMGGKKVLCISHFYLLMNNC